MLCVLRCGQLTPDSVDRVNKFCGLSVVVVVETVERGGRERGLINYL